MMKCLLSVLLLLSSCSLQNSDSAGVNEKSNHKLLFERLNDDDLLLKEAPMLKDVLMEKDDTEVYIAKFESNNLRFLFIRLEGPLYRGTEGSPVWVYMDNGKGYMPVLDVIAQEDISISNESPPEIYLGTREGGVITWRFDKRNQHYFPKK